MSLMVVKSKKNSKLKKIFQHITRARASNSIGQNAILVTCTYIVRNYIVKPDQWVVDILE